MRKHRLTLAHLLLVAVPVILLYAPFLQNPFVFDDFGFFLSGQVLSETYKSVQLHPRWLPLFTLSQVSALWGVDPLPNRILSLLLQVAVAWALYLFFRLLLSHTLGERLSARTIAWTALSGALLFALHPAAVYAFGYLIQRTIVMATLFSIITWYASIRAATSERFHGWLWLSVIAYALAIFSKQHAVTAIGPALLFAFLTMKFDNGQRRPLEKVKTLLLRFRWVIPAWLLLAGYVVYLNMMYVGVVYEPRASGGLSAINLEAFELDHTLSAVTQATLFFKYLFLWLVPVIQWMSVDMREPFAQSLVQWPYLAGGVAFVLAPLALLATLFSSRRKITALVCGLLIAPALLFVVELSTIRVQEIFVLYRSLLWMPTVALMIPLLLTLWISDKKLLVVAHCLFLGFLVALSVDRLHTFSNSYFLWEDAAKLIDEETRAPGIERPLYLSAYYLHRHGFAELALAQYDNMMGMVNDYAPAYKGRGMVNLDLSNFDAALADFDQALSLKPGYHLAIYGKGLTHMAMGKPEMATPYFAHACELKLPQACHTLKTGVPVR